MADNSEKILDVGETRKSSVSAGVPLARVDIYKLLHAVQGGIRSATHCLRVAGRNPTISMAS